MKMNKDDYEPYLVDQTVDEYCALNINPHSVEIEQIGMNALLDAVVKPTGIAVDILYLDRSPGKEVNTLRFEPTTPDGRPMFADPPVIVLLYRLP